MSKQHIGIIGMAVMGQNLAINIESHNYTVSVFNRSNKKTEEVINNNFGKKLVPFFNIKEFVKSLKTPRIILLTVKAGSSTDEIINLLKKYLEEGDIIIDGGNAFFQDTIRRSYELKKEGFNFIGAGISGGKEGALKGPSIMLGGSKEACELVLPMLTKIAAVADDGEPCITHVGPDGAGHYLKMIHNGIEYGDMQLIAEAYFILKKGLRFSNKKISQIFNKWNSGELNSYLIDITEKILIRKDEKDNYIIDNILDEAMGKGTGKWVVQSALNLDIPASIVAESVFARYISLIKKERILASKIFEDPEIKFFDNEDEFVEKLRRGLYLGKIISYAQNFSQLRMASYKFKWNLNYIKIAKIFRAGCIIRAKLLQKIIDSYEENLDIVNLMLSPYFIEVAKNYHQDLRDIVIYAIQRGIPVPSFSAAISYYDSYRTPILPANLIQAQRDYFGSHTYKSNDRKKEIFHTEWF